MYSWLPPYIYPLYERVTGRRFWSMTQQMLSLQWRSREELDARVEGKLRALFRHAYDHVPYYRTLWQSAGLMPEDVWSLQTLCALPITSKQDLRPHFPEHVVANSISPRRRRLTRTSGSSGIPLEFFTDVGARDVRAASLDFFRSLAGIDATDSHIVITSRREHPRSQPLQVHVRRILTGSRARYLSGIDASLTELREAMDGITSYYVQGYPSYIARLAREIERSKVPLRRYPKIVITDSETLTPMEAEQISRVFRCPVAVHYESFEFQSMAQSCPDYPQFLHVNSESILLEIVQEDGRPAPVGERGRVLITDLHNYVMPFIRYDIGDTAMLGTPCPCGRGLPTLQKLEGRSTEHIRTPKGRFITSGVLGTIIFAQQGFGSYIAEYQVIQIQPDDIVLKIVPTAGFTHDIERDLQTAFRTLCDDVVRVEIEIVDHIPREPNGKRLIIKSQLASGA